MITTTMTTTVADGRKGDDEYDGEEDTATAEDRES
jgi:hypothetical protein